MSETTDAVREAMLRNKQLAARHLVRKQDLEAELAKLRAQRDGIDASLAADPAVVELDARIADRTTQLQAATYDYQQAMNELGELDRLGTKALGLDARTIAASGSDPLIRSNEQIALDNVRERGADLDANDKLAQELGELDGSAPPKLAPVAAKPTREQADADAAAAFAALRAKRQPPASEPAPSGDDEPKPPPPKKTL
jgi:hypothetical protein